MFKKGLLLFVISALSATASADYGTLRVDEVRSVYDGDTFKVTIKSVHPLIGDKVSIRVAGVDTPELRAKCDKEKKLAILAKQYTVQFLRSANVVELRNIERGKYFRIVADVYADGRSLTNELLSRGLGVPYDGGKKVNWCS